MTGELEGGLQHWWQSTALHREMAYAGSALYFSGGSLVLLTLLVPSWEHHAPSWLTAVGVTALIVGAVFVWAAERRPIPLWLYAVVTSMGSVLVTVAVMGGGPETTATYGVLYVFVSAFGFYYYPWLISWWLVALSGAGFAVALAFHDVEAAMVQWIVIVGATVMAGGLIGSLGRRVRGLLAVEQVAHQELSELDEWKTTFLRAVTHDLRSPLAGMLGLLALLRDRGEQLSDEQCRDLVERSVANGERLQHLIDDLLDMERIEAGDIQPRLEETALDQLVRRTVDGLDLRDRTMNLDLEPVTTGVEPSKVERVVANLVGNAVRHTAEHSRVWVRLRDNGDTISLSVEDDGPGLPEHVRDDPFGAFRSRRDGSVGLGLHIVARFVELHGGTVEARERPGGVTCFEVLLPRAAA